MSDILRRQVTDNLDQLLDILPRPICDQLLNFGNLEQLIEVVLDLGRLPEARYFDRAEYLSEFVVTAQDLQECVNKVGDFSGDNRAGIESTLHRISAIRNRKGIIIGLTCRIGRAIYGSSELIRDLVETGKSILLLGKPGMGKTTALREIARILADEFHKRVVIIDTSNEIAGDGDVPHPAIGKSRRMQVARPEFQHQVMIEAVENHMPQVIVIDEIGTELEALASRTIAERGVQLIGTAHGNEVSNLIKNPTLSDLVGGIQSVTLGDEEARRRGTQKSILERKAAPTFEIAVEMLERYRWVVHPNVAETIDNLLKGRDPGKQIRSVDENGKVRVVQELAKAELIPNPHARGWRSTGKMKPLSPDDILPIDEEEEDQDFIIDYPRELNGDTCYVYLYGVSRHQADQVANTLQLPLVFSKDIDNADMVLTLRSHIRSNSKLRQLIESRTIPVHTIKSNTVPQITRALRRMLHLDEPTSDMQDFAYGDSEDELEALEEARLAVEQIVISKGQAVELLPRSSTIRKIQHELVEHYKLRSDSFGVEPNRRLRIYPL